MRIVSQFFWPCLLSLFYYSGSLVAQEASEAEDPTFSGLKYRSIGPAFMSGRIADIAIHPEDESTWYVAVGSGGLWKTTNNGISWQPIFDDQSSYSTGCITIDPQDPNRIWLGTGENVGGRHVGYGDGIYLSTDGGESWQNKGLKNSEHLSKIIVHPEDPDVLWVAAQGPLWSKGGQRGLYKSTDGGESWQQTLGDKEWNGVTDVVIDPRNPDRLYAATWQRHRTVAAYLGGGPKTALYRSDDGGETWKKLSKGLPTSNMGKIGLAISPQNPDVVYAAIELDQREGGLYKSTNRGASWTKESDAVSGATGPHYYQELYASPHKEGRLYLMDVRTQVSEDGGKSFSRMPEENKHSDNHAMAFKSSDPNYLLLGTDGGLYESFDLGKNWRFIDNLPITQFYKLAVDDAEPFYNIYGGTQDNNTQGGPSQTDNVHGIMNSDWSVVLFADGHQPATEPGNPDILYAQWQQGSLTRVDMKTGEVTYIRPQPAEGEEHERYNWDAPILVSSHQPSRIFHGSQRLWRSDDRGDNWTALSKDLTRGQERIEMPIMGRKQSWDNAWDFYAMSTYGTITSIAESPKNEDLLYVGTDDGLIQVTEDGGENWRKIEVGSLPDAPDMAYVNDIKADLFDEKTVYLALDNHKFGDFQPLLYKSSNAGKSWTKISNDLPEKHLVWRLVQDHEDKNLLFIGTEFGVFFSQNGGANWKPLQAGMPTIAVRDLTIQRREDDLVVSTFGRSFYILDDINPLRLADEEKLAAEASLFPVQDALWYLPRAKLSFGKDKGSQGESHFVAENPPLGAVFTYHLAEGYSTQAEDRRKKEKEVADTENIEFPGWEALAAEEQEEKTQLWLVVSDANGQEIRKIPAAVEKGFHRTNWDLRYPSANVVKSGQEEISGEGLLAPPGTYQVQLFKQKDGQMEELSEKESFTVRPLHEPSLENPNGDQRDSFTRRYHKLASNYSALGVEVKELEKNLKAISTAYQQAPGVDESISQEIDSLKSKYFELEQDLYGNSAKRKIGEKTKPTIGERLSVVMMTISYSSYGPTGTAQESMEIASNQLSAYQQQLEELQEEVRAIAEKIEQAGGPIIPGL